MSESEIDQRDMPLSGRNTGVVDDERGRLKYIESPLVRSSPSSNNRNKFERKCDIRPTPSQSSKKPTLNNRRISHVTPSPQSLYEDDNSQPGIPRSSSGKRQLFTVKGPKLSSESCDHAEAPRISTASQPARSLFRCKTRYPYLLRLRSEESSHGDYSLSRRISSRKGDYTSVPHGLTSWDSLASVASIIPVSPNKNKPSTKETSSPTLHRRRKRIDESHSGQGHSHTPGNSQRQSHSANSIPLELISLLLPAGLKSTKRLPQTHEEVIKKVAAQRKKQLPLRTKLPRNCKANRSIYTEESDDDLYFDTLLHRDNLHNQSSRTTRPVPTEVITHTETAASTADSTPTSTDPSPPEPLHHSPSTTQPCQRIHFPSPRHDQRRKVQPSMPCKAAFPIQANRGGPTNNDDDFVDNPTEPKRRKLASANHMQTLTNSQPSPMPNTRSQARREERLQASSPTSPRAISDAHDPDRDYIAKDVGERLESPKPNPAQGTRRDLSLRPKGTRIQLDSQQEVKIPNKTVPTVSSICPIVKVKTTTKSSNNSATKRHKVRFAPTTTTFSLKIQVKTSTSPISKKGAKISSPALSESAVQSIATQITQAYLAQSPSPQVVEDGVHDDSPLQSDGPNEGGERNVQDSDSNISIGSSDEIDSDSVQEHDETEPQVHQDNWSNKDGTNKNMTFKSHDQHGQEIFVAKNHMDSRSVASEITMDIDLLRGAKYSKSSTGSNYKNAPVSNQEDASVETLFAMAPSYSDDTMNQHQEENPLGADPVVQQCMDRSHRQSEHAGYKQGNDNYSPREKNDKGEIVSITNGMVLITGSPTKDVELVTKKNPSPKSKRRRLTSTDSLAGGSLLSIFSSKSTTYHVPNEVAVIRRRGSTMPSSPGREMNQNLGQQQRSQSTSSFPAKPDENIFAAGIVNDGDVDETVVTDKSHESRQAPALGKQCGKCSGCRQIFDCLSCSKCIASLQQGKCGYGKGTGCLKRICKLRAHNLPTDTLCRTSTQVPTFESSQQVHDKLECEGDDASRRSFGETGSMYSTASKVRRRRAARLWSRRWSTHEKQQRYTTTPTTKTSSVASESEKGDSTARRGQCGGSRNKKQRKSQLHDLELPMPTDGSLASILERRRSLHSLMGYDEADQDWL